ncbi:D-alanine--D-alanine ligase [Sulfuricaulis sp.]|jgi:D-alanine-D-alanine ligase|uniref:D-alanine--D-alanine ligase n=1 Tax=Sulfuricaulis sp. TaxID=2003553 RepID=UPI00355AC00D
MKRGNFGKVAVLMGGPSAEREVSLKSGNAVLAALKRQDVDAHGIDADRSTLRLLEDGGFDRVFIVLHGRWGEDGVIQGALEVLDIPYTGSGVLGSALGMDKLRSKYLWSAAGIPTPEYVMLEPGIDLGKVTAKLGLPVFVKPVREGSSLGISKAKTVAEMKMAWETAAKYDDQVIAERFIDGAELTCGILGNQALPLIKIETDREFYDYEAKYILDTTRYLCPCGLPADRERAIQALAQRAFDALGCSGWGRVDFMLDKAGQAYALEVNTVPGMTDHSLVPKAAKQAGMDFDQLVLRILETADVRR